MTIDEAIQDRLTSITKAITDATDKRRVLSALSMALAGITGTRPEPVRDRQAPVAGVTVKQDKRDCQPCRSKMAQLMRDADQA